MLQLSGLMFFLLRPGINRLRLWRGFQTTSRFSDRRSPLPFAVSPFAVHPPRAGFGTPRHPTVVRTARFWKRSPYREHDPEKRRPSVARVAWSGDRATKGGFSIPSLRGGRSPTRQSLESTARVPALETRDCFASLAMTVSLHFFVSFVPSWFNLHASILPQTVFPRILLAVSNTGYTHHESAWN